MTKKFKKLSLLLVTVLFSLVLSSCSFLENIFNKELDPETFDEVTKEMFYMLVGEDELTLNYLLYDREAYGFDYYEPYLPTPSVKTAVNTIAVNSVFGRIKRYDYNKLNDDQKMTYNIIVDLVDTLNAETSEMSYLNNNYLGSYLGYQAQLPIILTEYNFYTKQDIESYIKCVELIPDTFIKYYEFEVLKAEKGYGMPDFVIDNVLSQCENFIKAIDDNSSFMFHVINENINKCSFLSSDEKAFYIERNNEIIKSSMREGYVYLKDNLPSLKGKATNYQGLAHYVTSKNEEIGKNYYEILFKDTTGYDISCDDAIKYIDNKINEIINEMKSLGNVIKNNSALYKEYEQIYTTEKFMTTSTPLDQVYDFSNLIKDDFPELQYVPEVSIEYIHESLQDNFSPAAYVMSPIDSITSEKIYLNPASIYLIDEKGNSTNELDTKYLYTTLAHEGLPGHLYQNAYFKQLDVNPIRKVMKNTGYSDGWATYAENYVLKYLCGKYSETIIKYLQLENQLNAAIYSRMDLGIHYNGWTLDELYNFAKNYFSLNSAENLVPLYNQLVEIPTNCQQYYFTYLKICDMYTAVSDKLGNSFDEKEFHKYILDCGPAPLRFVEDVVFSAYGIK